VSEIVRWSGVRQRSDGVQNEEEILWEGNWECAVVSCELIIPMWWQLMTGALCWRVYWVQLPHSQVINLTGSCNWCATLLNSTGHFTYLSNIDVGKFTYLLATKPCYLLQSVTKQHKWNYWNLWVNNSWVSNYTIVHNVYSTSSSDHSAIKQLSHYAVPVPVPVGSATLWFWSDGKIYSLVHNVNSATEGNRECTVERHHE